ncbi:MAG: ribose 5-phosphate isomerase B [Clostridiales bacterium]|jgi:ribose 5-phosphate isomerase B|nr:ribose 5-phosphate isomerase B [Clostridiales bacterium]
MRIVIANDHTGLDLKRILKPEIESKGHTVIDLGTNSAESADYPIYGKRAADAVISGEADRAVLICGTGFGISLAANKTPGIRCVVCSEPYTALLSRLHNNSNALALGARVVGGELAKMILNAWLDAEFEGERHSRRLGMIEEIEKNILEYKK